MDLQRVVFCRRCQMRLVERADKAKTELLMVNRKSGFSFQAIFLYSHFSTNLHILLSAQWYQAKPQAPSPQPHKDM